jgi:hypothetical protein
MGIARLAAVPVEDGRGRTVGDLGLDVQEGLIGLAQARSVQEITVGTRASCAQNDRSAMVALSIRIGVVSI